jgi:hypothetical protein
MIFLEMIMAYHYHFCALAQKELGSTEYCDGVFTCEIAVRADDASYSNIKKEIAEQFKGIGNAPIAILSLTLINNE